MPLDENKDIVRRYFAALDRQDLTTVADLFAPDYRLRFDSNPEMERNGALGMFGMFFAAFPDVQHELHDLIAEGDRVAVRLTVHGTHKGDLMGMPPTGKPVAFGSSNVLRVARGQITEQWATTDMLGMMRQLGAIPSPDQAGG